MISFFFTRILRSRVHSHIMSMISGQVNVTLLHEMILLHDSVREGAVKVARPIGKPESELDSDSRPCLTRAFALKLSYWSTYWTKKTSL